MKLFVITSLAAAAVAFSAASQPPAKAQSSCFRTQQLRNHTVSGDAIYFDVNGQSVYRAETSGGCLAAVTSTDPIVMSSPNGNGLICNKMDLNIAVRGARCIVTSLHKLTPEEGAALPKGVKP